MVPRGRRERHLPRGTKPVCPQHGRGPSREAVRTGAHGKRATPHPTLRPATQRGQRRAVPAPEGLSQVKRDQNKLERSRSECKDPDLSLIQLKDSGGLANGTSRGRDPVSPRASPAGTGTPKCTLPFYTSSSSWNRPQPKGHSCEKASGSP